MSTLDKDEEGFTIISPDKTVNWGKAIFGFVNDNLQYANDWKNNSLITASNNLQSAAQS